MVISGTIRYVMMIRVAVWKRMWWWQTIWHIVEFRVKSWGICVLLGWMKTIIIDRYSWQLHQASTPLSWTTSGSHLWLHLTIMSTTAWVQKPNSIGASVAWKLGYWSSTGMMMRINWNPKGQWPIISVFCWLQGIICIAGCIWATILACLLTVRFSITVMYDGHLSGRRHSIVFSHN